MRPNTYKIALLSLLSSLLVSACGPTDPLRDESTLPDISNDLANRNELDKYIEEHLTIPYNVDIVYKYTDRELFTDWSATPIRYDKAVEFVRLIEYLYYEPFSKVTSNNFLSQYTPKQLLLLGSFAYSPNGLATYGFAYNGVKVGLLGINSLDTKGLRSENEATRKSTLDYLNFQYLRTLYHEGGHTFHQRIPFPIEYKNLAFKDYQYGEQFNYWKDAGEDRKKHTKDYKNSTPSFLYAGFISPYGSTEPDEDFAEVFSYCIMLSEEEWEVVYANADGKNNPNDPLTGKQILQRKREIIANYLKTKFSVDINELRAEVRGRYPNLKDMDFSKLN